MTTHQHDAMTQAGLTDAECDDIRNECNRKWLAIPVHVDRPPWEHWLIRAGFAAAQAVPREPTRAMVDRFLSWRLPKYFSPDCYITFDAQRADMNNSWPVGTNLLSSDQAREMLAHVLSDAAPQRAQEDKG